VGPPDVTYVFVSLGATLRLHFAEWASIWAGFNYHVVTSAGAVATADEYGPARTFGIRIGGGLDFFASDPPPALPGMNNVANTAVDQYFGGMVVVGYVY